MPTSVTTTRIATPKPLGPETRSQWLLDPAIDFLNHGCFGARTKTVLDAQATRRAEFEARPVKWLDRDRHDLIAKARRRLGEFIGASPENLGFVTNATGGVNAVLRSLTFKSGDELLTTNHVYNAVRQTMRYLAERVGAKYTEAKIPLPLSSPQQVIDVIEDTISARTRVLVIDHITSPTAVLFPVEEIVRVCAQRGIDVIIDGAHAPGMIDLNIESLGAAYYAGNLHKWVCAPPGAAFLWVRPDRQQNIHPLTVSHFLDESFHKEFEWQGTRDITPWLCVEDSLNFFDNLGWEKVRRHNHELAVWAQAHLIERWKVDPSTPLDGSMLGSMATMKLPQQNRLKKAFSQPEMLHAALYDRYAIEVPVIPWDEQWWIRVSCQIYNSPDQYQRLADAVLELVNQENVS